MTILKELHETLLEYYRPHYDATNKKLGGSVESWFKMLEIEKEDIKKAVKEIKLTTPFKKLLSSYNLEYKPSDRMESNGTLRFNSPSENANYIIYGNGQIRRESHPTHWITKLVSPKPRVVPGDPVKSMIKMYTASLEELHKKLKGKKDLARVKPKTGFAPTE